MRRQHWDRLLTSLVLVRLGQDLGTDSTLSRAIYDLAELAGKLACFFPVDRF